MKILAISDVPSKALWDYGTREHLEGIDLILSCGDLPQKYLEYLTNFTAAPILYVHGNTNDYDFVRLWAAPESIRTLKLQMLSAAFALAQKRPQGQAQAAVYQLLFTLAEDWDEELLTPVVQRAEELCRE